MITQSYWTTSFPNPLPPLLKSILQPLQTDTRSRTHIKHDILDLFRIAAIVPRPVDSISDISVAIGDLQIPSHRLLSDGGYCLMHMSSPGRLLVMPPLPYRSMVSQWKPKSSVASVCHISEEWSRCVYYNNVKGLVPHFLNNRLGYLSPDMNLYSQLLQMLLASILPGFSCRGCFLHRPS